MLNNLTEIPYDFPGKLYRSPMPFGPYDRQQNLIQTYQKAEIETVVVLVTNSELRRKSIPNLLKQYEFMGLEVLHHPIEDFGVPEGFTEMGNLLEDLQTRLTTGEKIVIHCSAGIGRTGLVIALLTRRIKGLEAEAAIQWVRQFIPHAVESDRQVTYVETFEF